MNEVIPNPPEPYQNENGIFELSFITWVDSVSERVSAATSNKYGVVKKVAAQADSTATDYLEIRSDFNNLLAKLRVAGIMAE